MTCPHPDTTTSVEGSDTVTRCTDPTCGTELIRHENQQYDLTNHADINDAAANANQS